MSRPLFVFTKHKNYYSVYVKNLESLSVPQIQEIELFVQQRKGVFDFQNYVFIIQRRLEFHEFSALMKYLEFDVICTENIIEYVAGARIGFGQYKGLPYSELPDTYLIWLKNNYRGTEKEGLLKEIEKRKL